MAMVDREPLIPKHGGYRRLKSFQIAQLAYDLTVRFCERYVDRFSRTRALTPTPKLPPTPRWRSLP
ncbi:hypothetical protein DSCOOX_39360 [Desulfosarcina ovata subsp. ovata]|uniref:Uncharacterized protein n=1 Tax=Desulfosarcina ovata subsp. ovata TaxID=2752305 RepID=A0A5K8ADZ1_9BACT|nr:hypothetical protein DSCOOX_39360 [Desulfosarcina ovata subsp. ovata]